MLHRKILRESAHSFFSSVFQTILIQGYSFAFQISLLKLVYVSTTNAWQKLKKIDLVDLSTSDCCKNWRQRHKRLLKPRKHRKTARILKTKISYFWGKCILHAVYRLASFHNFSFVYGDIPLYSEMSFREQRKEAHKDFCWSVDELYTYTCICTNLSTGHVKSKSRRRTKRWARKRKVKEIVYRGYQTRWFFHSGSLYTGIRDSPVWFTLPGFSNRSIELTYRTSLQSLWPNGSSHVAVRRSESCAIHWEPLRNCLEGTVFWVN